MARTMQIKTEDVTRYQRDGAVLIKGALDAEALQLLRTGVEEAYHSPGSQYSRVSSPSGAGETLVEQFVSRRSPALRALMDSGIVGEIGATVMQTQSAQLVLDQIFYKAKGPIIPTPWHQDTPFLRVRGDELVRVWMPCDFSPRQLTVQVVRGSHRWNVVYNVSGGQANEPSTIQTGSGSNYEGLGDPDLPPVPDVARYRESFDILSWDVEPGDALVFQGNMLHGADGHPDHDSPRRVFAALLGGPNLRYHAPKGKAFPTPCKVEGVTIKHGAPIGDYENAFPVCWRAAGAEAQPAAASG